MIRSGIVAGLKPNEIRDMIPKDTFLVFEGWSDAHSPKKPGSEALSAEEYKRLVDKVDGDQRSRT